MNMFARFDENPAMTLRVIKETKRYGRTDARTDGRTDGHTDNVKTVYPLQTKFAGGITIQDISMGGKHIQPLHVSDISIYSDSECLCEVLSKFGQKLLRIGANKIYFMDQ